MHRPHTSLLRDSTITKKHTSPKLPPKFLVCFFLILEPDRLLKHSLLKPPFSTLPSSAFVLLAFIIFKLHHLLLLLLVSHTLVFVGSIYYQIVIFGFLSYPPALRAECAPHTDSAGEGVCSWREQQPAALCFWLFASSLRISHPAVASLFLRALYKNLEAGASTGV